MSLVVVGTVAFDAIETPFGKTDKIIGGAATYILVLLPHILPRSQECLSSRRRFPLRNTYLF
jgi:hypothetical protein